MNDRLRSNKLPLAGCCPETAVAANCSAARVLVPRRGQASPGPLPRHWLPWRGFSQGLGAAEVGSMTWRYQMGSKVSQGARFLRFAEDSHTCEDRLGSGVLRFQALAAGEPSESAADRR